MHLFSFFYSTFFFLFSATKHFVGFIFVELKYWIQRMPAKTRQKANKSFFGRIMFQFSVHISFGSLKFNVIEAFAVLHSLFMIRHPSFLVSTLDFMIFFSIFSKDRCHFVSFFCSLVFSYKNRWSLETKKFKKKKRTQTMVRRTNDRTRVQYIWWTDANLNKMIFESICLSFVALLRGRCGFMVPCLRKEIKI